MNNTAPLNLLRLSFQSHLEYRSYAQQHAKMLSQIWLWHETLGNKPEAFQMPGICNICECQTLYTAIPGKKQTSGQFEHRINWWGSTRCGCGLSNLDRAVLLIFFEGHKPQDSVYHVGHHSKFRKWLSNKIPNLTSSQYEEGRSPGEVEDGIRYEDITQMSFIDGQFTTIICMEILEHIPDYKAALREMARALMPGGRALLSFPWLGKDTYEHRIRAEITENGTINHILPPEYHGDPAKDDGILSFRSFGWRILDELREAGFSSASAEFVLGPVHGYMTLLNPVIIAIR